MTRKRLAEQQRRGAGGGAGAEAAALKRGPWSPEEDELLKRYVAREGQGRWRTLPRRAGLKRCGKSCRLRWMNYLRPDIKREPIAADEEDLILRLHRLLGNRWSLIAGRLPGRTDNEIKNYWNSHLSKKLIAQGIDPRTHRPLNAASDSYNDDADKKPPVDPSSAVPPPPPPEQPSSSSGGAGVEADDGGSDFAAMMGFDADGFEGFGDQFRAGYAARGGFGLGYDMVDDGTFSSFLDSLINEDHFVGFFGDHKDV